MIEGLKDLIVQYVRLLILTFIISIFAAIPTVILWNWLITDIFKLPGITLYQAIGINFLSSILFNSGVSYSEHYR